MSVVRYYYSRHGISLYLGDQGGEPHCVTDCTVLVYRTGFKLHLAGVTDIEVGGGAGLVLVLVLGPLDQVGDLRDPGVGALHLAP